MNSEGIPLDVVIGQIASSGYIPDFYDFLVEAKKCGWNKKSTRTKLMTAVSDVYLDKKWKEGFEKRLDKFMGAW